MTAVTLMRTPAETGAGPGLRGRRRRRLPGDVESRARGLRDLRRNGPAAPPRRGVQVHRPARPDARGRAPRRRAPIRRRGAGCACRQPGVRRRRGGRRSPFVNGYFVRDAIATRPRCRRASRSSPLAEALAVGHDRCSRTERRSSWRATTRSISSTPPSWRTASVIRVDGAASRRPSICASSRRRATAVATATRVLVVVEDGATLTLVESHESRDGARAPAERRRRDRSPPTARTSLMSASTPRATRRWRSRRWR